MLIDVKIPFLTKYEEYMVFFFMEISKSSFLVKIVCAPKPV
jgi:hypothetical protein